jgi:hypothetical protein
MHTVKTESYAPIEKECPPRALQGAPRFSPANLLCLRDSEFKFKLPSVDALPQHGKVKF